MEIKSLLEEMRGKGASDLHLRANAPVVLRIDGKLIPLEDRFCSSEVTSSIAQSLMNEEHSSIFRKKHEVDVACFFPALGRFRVNIFRQRGFINCAFRYIPTKIPSIVDLKLPPVITQISENSRGLVLVTGTTGSGKSTTLASMINHINSTRTSHIVTIEDPIEFVHEDNKSIVSQRELGFDTLNFAEALKHVVRQDPDVILVGEMRDVDTMSAAITAAQTGHLVMSTIHTVDSVQTINRIIDMFPAHQQGQMRYMLADTLKAVVSQRLLPAASGKGRVPAVEVLIITPLIKKLIENNTMGEISNLMKQGKYYDMQTFNQALLKLFNSGDVKLEDALYAASNPEELMLVIRGVQTGGSDDGGYFDR